MIKKILALLVLIQLGEGLNCNSATQISYFGLCVNKACINNNINTLLGYLNNWGTSYIASAPTQAGVAATYNPNLAATPYQI